MFSKYKLFLGKHSNFKESYKIQNVNEWTHRTAIARMILRVRKIVPLCTSIVLCMITHIYDNMVVCSGYFSLVVFTYDLTVITIITIYGVTFTPIKYYEVA